MDKAAPVKDSVRENCLNKDVCHTVVSDEQLPTRKSETNQSCTSQAITD
jgi:hypothetical protein